MRQSVLLDSAEAVLPPTAVRMEHTHRAPNRVVFRY
jgi:hypothetical protein